MRAATTRRGDLGSPPPAASNVENDVDVENNDDDDIGIQLVARPPFVASAFARLDPDRFDRIRLYAAAAAAAKKAKDKTRGSTKVPDEEIIKEGDDDDDDDEPRYTVTVVDRRTTSHHDEDMSSNSVVLHNTVAFLVPAGREAEYMFGTSQGLQAVLDSAQGRRLLAVATGRNHAFPGGPAQIQHEVQAICQILHYRGTNNSNNTNSSVSKSRSSGRGYGRNGRGHGERDDANENEPSTQIPFVTTAEGVGERDIVARGTSELSGGYVVEQVLVPGHDNDEDNGRSDDVVVTARRLYFLSNPFVIQSEVCYRNNVLDTKRVAFEYHRAMVACLVAAMAPASSGSSPPPDGAAIVASCESESCRRRPRGLLLGLGGGGLLHYAHQHLPQLRWVAIELDPEVERIATSHFGLDQLVQSGYVDVHVANGLDVRMCADDDIDEPAQSPAPDDDAGDGARRDVAFAKGSLAFVVVDVDSKDATLGMSCPPPDFLQKEYLQTLAGLLTSPDDDDTGGVLVVNVSARDANLLDHACRSLRSVFSHVFTLSPGDDSLNVVVLASQHSLPFVGPAAAATSDSTPVATSTSLPPPNGLDDRDLRRLVDELRVWEPRADFGLEMLTIPESEARRHKKRNKKKGGKKKR